MPLVSAAALRVVYERLEAYEPDIGQLVLATYIARATALTQRECVRLKQLSEANLERSTVIERSTLMWLCKQKSTEIEDIRLVIRAEYNPIVGVPIPADVLLYGERKPVSLTSYGHRLRLQVLLKAGADPAGLVEDGRMEFGLTPLHVAGKLDADGDLIELFLKYASTPSPSMVSSCLWAKPLHYALIFGPRGSRHRVYWLLFKADPLGNICSVANAIAALGAVGCVYFVLWLLRGSSRMVQLGFAMYIGAGAPRSVEDPRCVDRWWSVSTSEVWRTGLTTAAVRLASIFAVVRLASTMFLEDCLSEATRKWWPGWTESDSSRVVAITFAITFVNTLPIYATRQEQHSAPRWAYVMFCWMRASLLWGGGSVALSTIYVAVNGVVNGVTASKAIAALLVGTPFLFEIL